ncbi:MAG: hypothetical protein ACK5R2_07315 [Cyanobacteriota bacterium]
MPSKAWPAFLPVQELLLVPGEERREAGSLHFSEALQVLLRYVSHPQLSDLADWACNEAGNLHISQISHMRNNKVRMLGTKAIDALGRVNQLAWVARHRSDLLPKLGTAPLTPRIQMILKAYQPLLHPISQEPLGAGDFMALYLGYLRLPIELPRSLSLPQAEQLAGLLGDWLEAQLEEKGLSFREASKQLQAAWSGEASGAKRLVRVLAGLEDYSPRQLADDWEAIGQALLTVLERGGDVWGLADGLLAELEPGEKGSKRAKAESSPARVSAEPVQRAQARRTSAAAATRGTKSANAARKPPAAKKPPGRRQSRTADGSS